ncbi:hypothetical protein GT002_39675, partial [Streptomyces sp. SID4917]|nr:hypothetical protein [Streptomyces sp. SID4917]
SGAGGRATFIPREDGGQTVAWGGESFAGSATVYPGTDEEPPHARVVFHRLDRDRYQALADSPWPYRSRAARSSTTVSPPTTPSRSSPWPRRAPPPGRGSATG